ncbi:MAG: NADH-quinone oxidoreductase subunit I [Deltaproteobacteria bacterium]|nr:NADH-quinone oxidoreductase subunit I [Deltaproteobacteria bacterium]
MAARVVKVKRGPELTLWERLYIPEIIRGLAVTSRHFFSNLWGFIIGKPRVATVQYPEQRLEHPAAFRGMPVLVAREDGSERCVACGMCEVACPPRCITIVPEETEGTIERRPKIFDIDLSRCMFCGLCEEACPEEAIVMSADFEIACETREGLIWGKEQLLKPPEQLRRRINYIRDEFNKYDSAKDAPTNVIGATNARLAKPAGEDQRRAGSH